MIVFDNATGVGRRVGGQVFETELFAKFRAHYLFELRFCNPNAGHEKGHVENKIGYTRRNLFVPERSFVDAQSFNQKLLKECEEKGLEEHYLKGELFETLFAEELEVMLPSRQAFSMSASMSTSPLTVTDVFASTVSIFTAAAQILRVKNSWSEFVLMR